MGDLLLLMSDLHEELGQCLVWAGLCGAVATAQSLSRGRKHSQAHSSYGNRSPLVENRVEQVAKQLRGDSHMRSPWPHSRHSRTKAWWHQSHQGDNSNQVRYLPRLQLGSLTVIPHHPQAQHTHTMHMNNYINYITP